MRKMYFILVFFVCSFSDINGQQNGTDNSVSINDSTLYYYKEVTLTGFSYTYRAKGRSHVNKKIMRIFKEENSISGDVPKQIDFSDHNTYVLLIPDEFLFLNSWKFNAFKLNDMFVDSSCSYIKPQKEKNTNNASIFKCQAKFALYFIEVERLKEVVTFHKKVNMPRFGYVKCLVPILDAQQ